MGKHLNKRKPSKQSLVHASKSRSSLIEARKFRYIKRWQDRSAVTNLPMEETRYWYGRYQEHKFNAHTRGIKFLLSFEEWFRFWFDSGHLHERGCKKGSYVMARIGDSGHYEMSNIEIILYERNLSDQSNNINRTKTYRKKMSGIMKEVRQSKPDWYSRG